MTDVPHISIPFRFGANGHAVTVEQDSSENIEQCVEAIVRTPIGFRLELPTFGVDPQIFAEGGPDPVELLRAIERWEPRASLTADSVMDFASIGTYMLRVGVDSRTEDG